MDFILQAPDQQDEGVWKYEHLRQFCLELNDLTVLLQVFIFIKIYFKNNSILFFRKNVYLKHVRK